MICNFCPRQCNVDRKEKLGYCKQTERLKLAKVMLHRYEEPIISGTRGSGAIFFSGCNLRCVFCQNYPISQGGKGKECTVDELINIFKYFEKIGAHNINLVSPTQFAYQIATALKIYKPKIPIVWNSNGYESSEMVEMLSGLVDIYLVDLKYSDNALALKYSRAKDYVENSHIAIMKMKEQQPVDIIENGLMKKGMIIRHLILPTHTSDSIKCLDFIAKNLGKDSIVSIMSQYEPRYDAKNYPEINRKIRPIEYKRVVNHALNLGLHNAYIQDLSSADSKYTPKF